MKIASIGMSVRMTPAQIRLWENAVRANPLERECIHGGSSLSCGVGHGVLLQPFGYLFLLISFRCLILLHHNTREKKKKSEPIPNRD